MPTLKRVIPGWKRYKKNTQTHKILKKYIKPNLDPWFWKRRNKANQPKYSRNRTTKRFHQNRRRNQQTWNLMNPSRWGWLYRWRRAFPPSTTSPSTKRPRMNDFLIHILNICVSSILLLLLLIRLVVVDLSLLVVGIVRMLLKLRHWKDTYFFIIWMRWDRFNFG